MNLFLGSFPTLTPNPAVPTGVRREAAPRTSRTAFAQLTFGRVGAERYSFSVYHNPPYCKVVSRVRLDAHCEV